VNVRWAALGCRHLSYSFTRKKNHSVWHVIIIVKIHLYTRLRVSAPWSHHQASTIEQIQIWFCTIGIPRVYSAEVYCLRCTGDWMELAQDRDRWRTLVGTVRNLRVP
jgi:hypothetical protein